MAVERKFFRPPAGHFFLFGPRGTGKSTWLRAALPDAVQVDLLAPGQQHRYAARPERLRELAAAPGAADLVIDEVQRVPELLTVVHQLMEERGGPRFVLTGSSARKLKRTGVDLLAGRAVVRSMHPFIAAELGDRFDLDAALDHGLLPLIWDADDPADTSSAYAGMYVQQEVQAEGLVRDLGAFHRFLEAVSFSHAAVLNASEVARECAVRRKTVEGFIEIVEDLLLAFRLPVFARRARRQVIAHPKFYFADAGVFRSLRPAGPLDRPEEARGAALEGLNRATPACVGGLLRRRGRALVLAHARRQRGGFRALRPGRVLGAGSQARRPRQAGGPPGAEELRAGLPGGAGPTGLSRRRTPAGGRHPVPSRAGTAARHRSGDAATLTAGAAL